MLKRLPQAAWIRIVMAAVLTAALGLAANAAVTPRELRLAAQALDSNDPLAAALHMRRAAGHQPWRADLWLAAGYYALWGGDEAAALAAFQRPAVAAMMQPDDLLALGDAHHGLGQDAQALAAWEAALPGLPDPNPVYERRLALHQQQGDLQAETADLEALLAAAPAQDEEQSAERCLRLGLLYSALQPQKAPPLLARAAVKPALAETANKVREALLSALLSEEPAYHYLQSGRALAAVGEWPLAVAALQQSTALPAQYSDAWAYLGEALQHIETGKEAESGAYPALQQALALNPGSLVANTLMGLYWQRQGDPAQALLYLQAAVRLAPENPALHAQLAEAYAAAADLPNALVHFEQAIALAPTEAVYWRIYAEFLLSYHLQLAEKALPAARQAVLLAPADPAVLDVQGQVLLQLGDHYEALRFFERAIQADPGYYPAYLHTGQTYMDLNQRDQAYLWLLRARELAKTSP